MLRWRFSCYLLSYRHLLTTKCINLILILCLYLFFRAGSTWHKQLIPVLLLFVVVSGLVEAIWGLLQLYGFAASQHTQFRATGSFFNPGPYGGYLAVVLPLALYGSWHIERFIRKPQSVVLLLTWMCRITVIAILLVLPATMSRAAWLAALAGCLFIVYSKYNCAISNYIKKYKKKVVLCGCLLTICGILALSGIYLLKKDSADGRLLMWKTTLKAIFHHPGGVGIGQFPQVYGQEQAAYFASGKGSQTEQLLAGNPEYGFNEYLQLAAEWGVLPFILFVALLVQTILTGYKNRCWPALASLLSLLVFASMSYPFSLLPFVILLAFLLSVIHTQKPKKTVIRKHPYTAPVMLFLCLLITGLALYNRYPVYQAYKKWHLSQIFYNMNNHDIAAKEYTPLYPLLDDRIQFLFEYSRILSQTNRFEESNRVLEKAIRISCDPMLFNIRGKNLQALKQYNEAEEAFMNAAYRVPSRIYPWYLLMKLYNESEQHERAMETARIVVTKEPKVHSRAVDEMREEAQEIINRNNNQ